MAKSVKSRTHYSEEIKLSVLKDIYENNLTLYGATKKHGIVCQATVGRWVKQFQLVHVGISSMNFAITQ